MKVSWNREAEDECVQIASVMHTSRHPDYWKSRLKDG